MKNAKENYLYSHSNIIRIHENADGETQALRRNAGDDHWDTLLGAL